MIISFPLRRCMWVRLIPEYRNIIPVVSYSLVLDVQNTSRKSTDIVGFSLWVTKSLKPDENDDGPSFNRLRLQKYLTNIFENLKRSYGAKQEEMERRYFSE